MFQQQFAANAVNLDLPETFTTLLQKVQRFGDRLKTLAEPSRRSTLTS